jgi:monoterpene epsilon-lactone hydrolase
MSWQNVALTWALRRWIKPNSIRGQDVAASRALTGRVPFGAKLTKTWRVRLENGPALKGEWTEPAASDHPARDRCILYFHGGAYIAMSARSYRTITSRLATWSNTRLFALDYRLAPEHPFPAALDDAIAAYRALIAAGTPPARIFVAGDSAGGPVLRIMGHPGRATLSRQHARDPPACLAGLRRPDRPAAIADPGEQHRSPAG